MKFDENLSRDIAVQVGTLMNVRVGDDLVRVSCDFGSLTRRIDGRPLEELTVDMTYQIFNEYLGKSKMMRGLVIEDTPEEVQRLQSESAAQ